MLLCPFTIKLLEQSLLLCLYFPLSASLPHTPTIRPRAGQSRESLGPAQGRGGAPSFWVRLVGWGRGSQGLPHAISLKNDLDATSFGEKTGHCQVTSVWCVFPQPPPPPRGGCGAGGGKLPWLLGNSLDSAGNLGWGLGWAWHIQEEVYLGENCGILGRGR